MPERRRGIQPHNWPKRLPPPSDPDLPVRVIAWVREALPAEEWRVEALRRRPWELVGQSVFVIDRMIESLRESYRETRDVYGPVLGPAELAPYLAAHTAEAERLSALRAQFVEVEAALTAAGRIMPL
ncbi:hypothetical protein [Streptacidiphilus carbonis]|uniref:hypothetical protein n=1 Tax=Streptacidiphilus carbonis TaxID=105422 RepID=UPI0005A922D4|nr:hypothetical protein [Streptacidiphilus carbonis]